MDDLRSPGVVCALFTTFIFSRTFSAIRIGSIFELAFCRGPIVLFFFALVVPDLVWAEDVRVRLKRMASPFTVAGMDLRIPGLPMQGPVGFRTLRVSLKNTEASRPLWEIADRDTDEKIAQVRASALEISGSSLRINLMQVPERLSFVPARRGQLDLIAHMDIEKYLLGVLPSEMPKSWPLEALKAQAVAARTFALYRKRERLGEAYHLESDVMDQVFHMPLFEKQAEFANVEKAVLETKGMILRDQGRAPFATYFHADCGGKTEDPRAVWGGGVSHRSKQGAVQGTVQDESCPLSPQAQWQLHISSGEIVQRLRHPAAGGAAQLSRLGSKISRLRGLRVAELSASGRVQNLKLEWDDGSVSEVTGHQFRMAVGFERVKSTKFSIVRDQKGLFQLTGQGHGHGAGMCQWGARHLASTGKKYQDILKHYYPQAALEAATIKR